ncbi:hypothetical protein AA958_00190 [Streptomyces sp. CNQ-509]|uniref:hypothetical protein n=1 Tax=Streptomyces sp. CNQ-509 TaxID=444103 RepID=UPI00062E04FA|nr:hypothetical protein [Streptomyces sp. CNQ-509]AKH80847.1 hypothetical protein AA958_00190 [Streptomyces sp. CNQ-509]
MTLSWDIPRRRRDAYGGRGSAGEDPFGYGRERSEQYTVSARFVVARFGLPAEEEPRQIIGILLGAPDASDRLRATLTLKTLCRWHVATCEAIEAARVRFIEAARQHLGTAWSTSTSH